MGRFRPTATMQVYAFEQTWSCFAKSPHKATHEAFGALIAMAHYHAAAIAHAGSSHVFELIVLSMLVGVVRRAEVLQEQGILSQAEEGDALQADLRRVMHELRQRLAKQNHELYTLARALRTEDQHVLLSLLKATQSNARTVIVTKLTHAALVSTGASVTDETLLTILIECMRQIRRLEKQQEGQPSIVTFAEWNQICAA